MLTNKIVPKGTGFLENSSWGTEYLEKNRIVCYDYKTGIPKVIQTSDMELVAWSLVANNYSTDLFKHKSQFEKALLAFSKHYKLTGEDEQSFLLTFKRD